MSTYFFPTLKNDWKYGFNFQWATKLNIMKLAKETKKNTHEIESIKK